MLNPIRRLFYPAALALLVLSLWTMAASKAASDAPHRFYPALNPELAQRVLHPSR